MARKAVLTCPNCGVKIEYITLHRGKVLGWHYKRERKSEALGNLLQGDDQA